MKFGNNQCFGHSLLLFAAIPGQPSVHRAPSHFSKATDVDEFGVDVNGTGGDFDGICIDVGGIGIDFDGIGVDVAIDGVSGTPCCFLQLFLVLSLIHI